MSKFKLGDLVEIVQDGGVHESFVGMVGEVVGLEEGRLCRGQHDRHPRLVSCYLISIDHGRLGAFEHQLRLIEPPGSERAVSHWSQCPWKPNGVTA